MLKHVLLAASVAVAAPALAQEFQPAEPAATPDPAESHRIHPVPEEGRTTVQQPPASEPAGTAANPATTQSEVAAVVAREFPAFDKDGSGALDKAEFSAWMTALRKAAEPTFQAESAEATAWTDQAFAQADVDSNAAVNEAELTAFLTPRPS